MRTGTYIQQKVATAVICTRRLQIVRPTTIESTNQIDVGRKPLQVIQTEAPFHIIGAVPVAGFKDITQAGSFNTLSRFYIVVEKMQTYTWFLHRFVTLRLQTEQSHQQEYG